MDLLNVSYYVTAIQHKYKTLKTDATLTVEQKDDLLTECYEFWSKLIDDEKVSFKDLEPFGIEWGEYRAVMIARQCLNRQVALEKICQLEEWKRDTPEDQEEVVTLVRKAWFEMFDYDVTWGEIEEMGNISQEEFYGFKAQYKAL